MKQLLAILLVSFAGACAPDTGGDCSTGGCGGNGGGAGCPAGTAELVGAEDCVAVGWHACGAHFNLSGDGWGCTDTLPESPCPAGTREVLGSVTCEPVGWVDCPAGFETAASGWGCAAIVTDQSCDADSKPVIGSGDCVPIGDCDDFPPHDATLFVDPAFSLGELDATHFQTVADAVAAASTGSVIAVERGTYPEVISLGDGITLVGRCAAEVSIHPPSADYPGISVASATNVAIRDLTIRGASPGIEATYGSTLDVERVVLAGNRISGMQILDAGTEVTIHDSSVRDSVTDAQGRYGIGIAVGYGAQLTITESALVNNGEHGLYVDWDESTATGERLIINHTQKRPSGLHGNAVRVMHTGHVSLTQSLLAHNHSMTVSVGNAGSTVALEEVEILDTLPGQDSAGTPLAYGVVASDGAGVSLTNSAVRQARESAVWGQLDAVIEVSGSVLEGSPSSSRAIGLTLANRGRGEIENTAVIASRGTGLIVLFDSAATLSGSLVSDTTVESSDAPGTGILVEGSTLTAEDITLRNNSAAGLVVQLGAFATVGRSVVLGTESSSSWLDRGYGMAVLGEASLEVSDCLVAESTVAGLVAAVDGELTATRTLVRDTRALSGGDYGYGVSISEGSTATLTDVGLSGNRSSSLVVNDSSQVDVTRLTVADTRLSTDGWGRAVSVGYGSSLTLGESALLGSTQAALAAFASGVAVRRSLICGTAPTAGQDFGHGILAVENSVLEVEEAAICDNAGAGIFVAAAQGRVGATRIAANRVGIHTQDGTVLTMVTQIPAVIPTGELVVDEATFLAGNGTDTSQHTLPIGSPDPSPL